MRSPGAPPEGQDADETAGGGDTLQQLGRYAGHGLTIALSTGLFAWLGLELDGRLRTEPLFVLLGAFVGFGAGFYSMYRHLVLDGPAGGGAESRDGDEE